MLALLLLQVCAGLLDVSTTLFAGFMSSLGASSRELGWVLLAGWAAAATGSLAGGQVTDLLGPRAMVLSGASLTLLGLLGEGLARIWPLAGLGYLLILAAQSGMYPAILRLVEGAAPGRTGSVIGFLHTAYCLVAIPGALLAGWVAERLGWPAVFLTKVALYLLAILLLALLLPRGRPDQPVAGKRERASWRPLLRHVPLRYLCAAVISATALGYAASFFAYDLQARFAAGPIVLARFAAIYNAVWTASNWPAGLLSDRWGRWPVAMLGFGLMGLSWGLFPWPGQLVALYPIYGLYCLGNSLGYYTTLAVMETVPEAERGRAVGLFDACMEGGAAVGDGAGGALWSWLGATPSYLLAALGMAGAVVLLAAGRRARLKG